MTVLTVPRLASYFITWCLGVVASAACLNGLIKARNDRDASAKLAESLAPLPGLKVDININDSLTAGGFLAAGDILISLIAFFSFTALFLSSRASHSSNGGLYENVKRRTEKKSTQMFAIGWWIFAIVWTFISAVIGLDYGRNRSAKTRAFLSGQEIPQETVQALQAATGLSSRYWIHYYVKFAYIAPWPLLFFTAISLVLTIMARSRTPAHGTVTESNSYGTSTRPTGDVKNDRTSESIDEEKAAVKHAENNSV